MAGFFRAFHPSAWFSPPDQAERSISEGRNIHQEHMVPDAMPPPGAADCVHDPSTGVTWVRDGPLEHAAMSILGLHQIDSDGDGETDRTADTWRGTLSQETVNHLLADPDYDHEVRALAGSWLAPNDPLPTPGLQAEYDPGTGHFLPGGTFDYAAPGEDIASHRVLDVGAHDAFGGYYDPVDETNGQDFHDVRLDSSEANEGTCQGGVDVHGLGLDAASSGADFGGHDDYGGVDGYGGFDDYGGYDDPGDYGGHDDFGGVDVGSSD